MDFSTGLAALQAAGNLVGLLVNERDRQKAAALQIDLTQKIIEAQAQFLEVQSAVIAQNGNVAVLEQRLRELQSHAAEKQRYQLAKLGVGREFFAYRLRPPAELLERADEVAHFACQPCFEGGKKIVLSGNGDGYWECPACKHGAQVSAGAHLRLPGRSRGF